MISPVLILPGYGGSGPKHWQSLWELSNPEFERIQQRDWDKPVCAEWIAGLEAAVNRIGPRVVLVAHSLACLAVAHWAAQPHAPIQAALLVAVPDPAKPIFPAEAVGFSSTPICPFTFRSTMVVSSDDPYASQELSARLAKAWGSHLINIGNCGHINSNSNLGAWAQGYELLEQLRG